MLQEVLESECSAKDNLKSLAIVFADIQREKEKRTVDIAELLENRELEYE
ncbi:MAG: hypothetical protein QGG39_04510 [Candidatus Poribacteria bacterium]|nr:hypothetical protein [Candidatus Poribacteria bacterium]